LKFIHLHSPRGNGLIRGICIFNTSCHCRKEHDRESSHPWQMHQAGYLPALLYTSFKDLDFYPFNEQNHRSDALNTCEFY
jgi:hypothetical protein